MLGGREQQGWRCLRGTYPGQNAPVLVARTVLDVDQFDLEIVEIGVVQPKLAALTPHRTHGLGSGAGPRTGSSRV